MYNDYHITMDSFGQDCPANWEEIASFLNDVIDKELEACGDDAFDTAAWKGLSDEGHEIVNSVWERYCNGELPGCPETSTAIWVDE